MKADRPARERQDSTGYISLQCSFVLSYEREYRELRGSTAIQLSVYYFGYYRVPTCSDLYKVISFSIFWDLEFKAQIVFCVQGLSGRGGSCPFEPRARPTCHDNRGQR